MSQKQTAGNEKLKSSLPKKNKKCYRQQQNSKLKMAKQSHKKGMKEN